MTTARTRLFLGILPPEDVRTAIADRARSVLGASGMRVYAAADLHLTLVFLGHVDPECARRVAAGMAEAFADAAPLALRVGGTGSFPVGRRERALWAGFEPGDRERARLEDLVARGRRLAARSGVALDPADLARPFTPHLTLARPRGGESVPAGFASLRFDVAWVSAEVCLFESVGAGVPGGRYPVRARAALAGV